MVLKCTKYTLHTCMLSSTTWAFFVAADKTGKTSVRDWVGESVDQNDLDETVKVQMEEIFREQTKANMDQVWQQFEDTNRVGKDHAINGTVTS